MVEDLDRRGLGDDGVMMDLENGSDPPYARIKGANNRAGCNVLAVYPNKMDMFEGKDISPLWYEHLLECKQLFTYETGSATDWFEFNGHSNMLISVLTANSRFC